MKLLNGKYAKEILVPVLIVTFFSIIFAFSQNAFYNEGSCFGKEIEKVDSIQAKTLVNANVNDTAYNRINAIYKEATYIKKPYMALANNYFSYGSSYALVLCISSVFTVIFTFLIAKVGWDNAGLLLKTTFLSFSFVTTFNTVLPKVFKNTENTQKNLDRYKAFNKVQNDAYVYMVNYKNYSRKTLDSAVGALTSRIVEEQNFLFEIDISKVQQAKDLDASLSTTVAH